MGTSIFHDRFLLGVRSAIVGAFLLTALPCGGFLPTAVAYVDPTTGEEQATSVLRGADIPEQNWLPGHRGVDLAARIGQDIVASDDGVVAFAGVVAGVPAVSIDHPDGIRTTYQPVHATVKQGDEVVEGQKIGKLGQPFDGFPGLHWGALTGKDAYTDPLGLLDEPVIRLKPVDAPDRRRS